MKRINVLIGIVAAALAAGSARAQNFEINWSTIDGGGVLNAAGGPFVLSGTIGQPDAGDMTGGPLVLRGGFWPGAASGGGGGGGCNGQETYKKVTCKTKRGAVKKLIVIVKDASIGETLTAVLDSGQSLDRKVSTKGQAKFVFKGGNAPPCGENAVTVCDVREVFDCGC